MNMDKEDSFPLDWNEWSYQFAVWITEQTESGKLKRSSYKFPGKNFMADEILGVWEITLPDSSSRVVELSETTFMEFRGVGITYAAGDERYLPSDLGDDRSNVCHTFAELEAELFHS